MKDIKDFISFRKLCLINAETALTSAMALRNQKANHISYHLCTLALEEIGKVFIAWFNYNRSQKLENEDGPLALDDHTKKIFWAFWWETFGEEIPTQLQIDSNRKLASNIHSKRLQSLYTETTDTVPASDKISEEELDNIIELVRARLELAKADDFEVREESEELKKFMILTNDPEKRRVIFGEDAQSKLIESGDVKTWVNWLIAKFDAEQIELDSLLMSFFSTNFVQFNHDILKIYLAFKEMAKGPPVRTNNFFKIKRKGIVNKNFTIVDSCSKLIAVNVFYCITYLVVDDKIPPSGTGTFFVSIGNY